MKVKYINLNKNLKFYYIIESDTMVKHCIRNNIVEMISHTGKTFYFKNVTKIVKSDVLLLLNGDTIKACINMYGYIGVLFIGQKEIRTYTNYRKQKQLGKDIKFI